MMPWAPGSLSNTRQDLLSDPFTDLSRRCGDTGQ